mmetsp:Transcript_23226/g.55067  ORF Transcript_23226/g.55067 Transcript_23226/m.55067 type:complete len:357 (-) Transcript_23226:55-1125(-)
MKSTTLTTASNVDVTTFRSKSTATVTTHAKVTTARTPRKDRRVPRARREESDSLIGQSDPRTLPLIKDQRDPKEVRDPGVVMMTAITCHHKMTITVMTKTMPPRGARAPRGAKDTPGVTIMTTVVAITTSPPGGLVNIPHLSTAPAPKAARDPRVDILVTITPHPTMTTMEVVMTTTTFPSMARAPKVEPTTPRQMVTTLMALALHAQLENQSLPDHQGAARAQKVATTMNTTPPHPMMMTTKDMIMSMYQRVARAPRVVHIVVTTTGVVHVQWENLSLPDQQGAARAQRVATTMTTTPPHPMMMTTTPPHPMMMTTTPPHPMMMTTMDMTMSTYQRVAREAKGRRVESISMFLAF